MKPLALCCLTISFAAAGCHAQAVRCGLAEVTVVDRDSGTPLATHYYRGEYWVAGRPGTRYAVEVHNRSGERLLAVTSVDGINVISGATAGWDQTGYVFAPWERYAIDGWRKSDSEVADFTFTSLPNSYAVRTGRPANVGVIGVALFRERRPEPEYAAPARMAPSNTPSPELDESPPSTAAAAGAHSPIPAAEAARSETRPVPGAAPKLGTGHGEREYSYVSNTDFKRMQDAPNAVIRIHYDSFDNLVAMGVVPRTRQPWADPNPFPGSGEPRFVPDPPG